MRGFFPSSKSLVTGLTSDARGDEMDEDRPVQGSNTDTSTNRSQRRKAFLKICAPRTRDIQLPLIDPVLTRGHPNPTGLGEAAILSRQGSWGQSSVLFETLGDYHQADGNGRAPYGGAEYGVVQTPEADAVCKAMAKLHNGTGAIICPSGLSAITTTLEAFSPEIVVCPANVYKPVLRFLDRRHIPYFMYAGDASREEFESVITGIQQRDEYTPKRCLIYLEAPGSGTFEIPDIEGIVAVAKAKGIRTVMDNTWASHVRFRPIQYGIDIVIQATTKHEGGYGDTPSGVVIVASATDHKILSDELRASGNGAVAPTTCARLLGRLQTTEQRLDQHEASAATLIDWFLERPYVQSVLSPTLETSPDHERFLKYFGKGNGLFSVAFREGVSEAALTSFVDNLNIFWVAESWGGHVSLVLPVREHGAAKAETAGLVLRFHAGLEDSQDLIRDLEQAERIAFTLVVENGLLRQTIEESA